MLFTNKPTAKEKKNAEKLNPGTIKWPWPIEHTQETHKKHLKLT